MSALSTFLLSKRKLRTTGSATQVRRASPQEIQLQERQRLSAALSVVPLVCLTLLALRFGLPGPAVVLLTGASVAVVFSAPRPDRVPLDGAGPAGSPAPAASAPSRARPGRHGSARLRR